jgi:hypothetical protein
MKKGTSVYIQSTKIEYGRIFLKQRMGGVPLFMYIFELKLNTKRKKKLICMKFHALLLSITCETDHQMPKKESWEDFNMVKVQEI